MPRSTGAMRSLLLFAFISLCSLFAQEEVTKQNDHLYNARYGEIIVVTGGPLHFTGHVYNTIGLNSCPEEAWKALNPEKLKKEYKARAVVLNGPRYFLMDESSLLNPGKVASFGGLQARYLANVNISPENILRGGSTEYTENTVARTTRYIFRKGRTIYELTSPEGRNYVMQSYSRIIDPKMKETDLINLGSRLTLPPGWHYQTRMLTQDYLMSTSGVAYVLQDNFKNSYQRE
ncbi:MAG: hypothetical protein ACOYK6_08885 [Chthoniobacterales bacterium]